MPILLNTMVPIPVCSNTSLFGGEFQIEGLHYFSHPLHIPDLSLNIASFSQSFGAELGAECASCYFPAGDKEPPL
jgi:hypothetical protein